MLWSADETALDLFARRPTRGFLTGLAFLDAPVHAASAHGGPTSDSGGYQPRHVLEVSGDDHTPKTLVLLHVIAAFLTRDAAALDGSHTEASEVFVFDHECELSARVLFRIVCEKLLDTIQDPTRRQATTRRLLDRVVVFRCRDSFQWLATLNHLHFQLLDAAPALRLIVINHVGSFRAIDKMVAKSVGDGLALADQVFVLLKQFIRHHSPIVVAAKRTPTLASNAWDSAETMPTSWSRQVSKRIQLRRVLPKPDDKDAQTTERPKAFESRSFSHGKSQTSAFCVSGISFVEDTVDHEMVFASTGSLSVPPTSSKPSDTISIAEADTNAAQLWMQ